MYNHSYHHSTSSFMRSSTTCSSACCLSTKSYSFDSWPLLTHSEKSKVLLAACGLPITSLRSCRQRWMWRQYSKRRWMSSVSFTASSKHMCGWRTDRWKSQRDELMKFSQFWMVVRPGTRGGLAVGEWRAGLAIGNVLLAQISLNQYLPTNHRMLKSFDFFRKIRTEQELTSATGGCFTVLSLLSAGFLILLSLQDFYQEKYFTFLSVKNDQADFLPMKIDILFYHMPCEALAIEFKDELQYVQHSLESKVTLYHVEVGQLTGIQYKRSNNREAQKENLKRHLVEESRCRATGIIPLPKTPGTLLIGASGQGNLIWQVQSHLVLKTRLNYRLDSLSFGLGNNTFDFPISHKSKNIENYINELEGDFNTRKVVQDFQTKGEKLNFFNHLKIIPVVIEGDNKQDSENYRYSIRSGWTYSNEPTQKAMFMTEIQPINITYRKHQPAVYELVRQILAIVGGTVATIGIFNSISHFFFNIK